MYKSVPNHTASHPRLLLYLQSMNIFTYSINGLFTIYTLREFRTRTSQIPVTYSHLFSQGEEPAFLLAVPGFWAFSSPFLSSFCTKRRKSKVFHNCDVYCAKTKITPNFWVKILPWNIIWAQWIWKIMKLCETSVDSLSLLNLRMGSPGTRTRL